MGESRTTIDQLRAECEALTKVYVIAARLRTFPVLFDDHFQLVGAVDECRSILEPPVDTYEGISAGDQADDWQEHDAAQAREEFLSTFREAHATLHQLWTAAVGKEGYDKAAWRTLDNALARFARNAAVGVGIDRSEPLL